VDCPGKDGCKKPSVGEQDPKAKVGMDEGEPELPKAKPKAIYTYRGDTREPWEIFDAGFEPLGFSTDLFLHAKDNRNPPSIYISTTPSMTQAKKFATGHGFDSGYVYVLKNVPGIDVNKKLGLLSPHRKELEIAVPGGVDKKDIVGATPVNADGSFVGYSIPNFDR
jgi:hypothetical protein